LVATIVLSKKQHHFAMIPLGANLQKPGCQLTEGIAVIKATFYIDLCDESNFYMLCD